MYDWANSAFQTTIIAAVFPIYFKRVAASGLEEADAMARFAWATTLAIFIVAIVAPVLGAIADHSAVKKRLLAVFAGIGISACFAMFWITEGEWLFALVLFVIGNVGVAGSIVFYESLLPHIVAPRDLDRVSSAGYAIGYLGGGVLLAFNLSDDSAAADVRSRRRRHRHAVEFRERGPLVAAFLAPALPHGSGAARTRRRYRRAYVGRCRRSGACSRRFASYVVTGRPFSSCLRFSSTTTGSRR